MMNGTPMRFLRGVGALLALLAVVVALPIGLWAVAGSPIPQSIPSWDEATIALSRPDVTGQITLGLIKYAGWLAWLTFTIAVLVELPAQIRGIEAPHLKGLGSQQRAAGLLVAAVIAMLTVAPTATTAAAATNATAGLDPQTTAPVVTQVEAAASNQTTTGAAAEHETQRQDEKQAEPRTVAYTVRTGDSLWKIAAEQLGDGQRYQEIADLNYGSPQPGGYSLDTSHWIDPGWTLQLPADAASEKKPTKDDSALTYTVKPGDNLWQIAEKHLGDGERYQEIVTASQHIDQGDGARLTHPELLQPGWTLHIPTPAHTDKPAEKATQEKATPEKAAEEDAAPTSDDAAEPTTDVTVPDAANAAPPAASSTPAPTREQAVTPDRGDDAEPATEGQASEQRVTEEPATDVDEQSDVDDDDAAIDVRTAAGVGGLMAAGVLSLLAARRAVARRRRKAGERIALPAPDSGESVLEAELRAVADPLGVEIVDVAMRSMAAWHRDNGLTLPDVRAARLRGEYFELYLEAAADLPEPWIPTADRHVWRLTAENAAALDLRNAAEISLAPYPSLVTIGHDEEDAHLLLDLEQLDGLDITGDTSAANATLAALAVELATSPWADDLQVTCIGVLDDLDSALDTGRIRHVQGLDNVLRELEARADSVQAALEHYDVKTLAEARGRGVAPDAWTPEIVLIGTQISPESRKRLEDVIARVPRVGVAAVTNDARVGQWSLDLDQTDTTRGTLQPAELDIRPQQVDAETYRHLVKLLHDQQDNHAVPGPAWAAQLTEVPAPDLDILAAATPRLAVVPDLPHDHDQTPRDEEPAEDDDFELQLPSPLVRVLGPVVVEGAQGTRPPSNHLRRATEIATFLAFHPEGVTTAELTGAIWPDSRPEAAQRTRPPAISQVRTWLGQDEHGTDHLPRFWTGEEGQQVRDYRLQGVATDWSVFLELVGDDVTTAPTNRLAAALDLVRGRPFADDDTDTDDDGRKKKRTRKIRYVWGESHAQEMMAAVVDVAHEVASRALHVGDAATARRAAEAGRRVDPADERGWRDGIRAEWAAGQRDAAQRLVVQLRNHLESIDLEPDTETEQLLADLAERTTN